jgi:predicted Zn-dependent protease
MAYRDLQIQLDCESAGPRRSRWATGSALLLQAGLVGLVGWSTLFALPAHAWSARKKPPASKPAGNRKQPKPKPVAGSAAEAPLAERVAALLARPKPPVADLLRMLRQAVGARETALAIQLAERIAASDAGAGVLQDAAQTLGVGSNLPVVQQLWAQAWKKAKGSSLLRAQIAEGYADSLLAAGLPAQAGDVLRQALRQTPRGQRRALYERLAAVARLQGEMGELTDLLLAEADPDALVLASQLLAESGDEEAAKVTLTRAWSRFPGHRALQAAYVQLLQRQGEREELRRVVDQVVRLAPADPMPYLAVLDADLAVRDRESARVLIDELVRRYSRHAPLLEALLDREQRLGDDAKRVGRLYELLVAASPGDPQPLESWGEWLLGRGDEAGALVVLARLTKLPAGAAEGMRRQVELLLTHNRTAPAIVILARLRQVAGDDPRVVRLQAQLAERSSRPLDAEPFWLALCEVKAGANPAQRARAAEARVSVGALYRRMRVLLERVQALQAGVLAQPDKLGQALLWLDLVGQLDDPLAVAGWQDGAAKLRAAHAADTEVLAALAGGELLRGQLQSALMTLEVLHGVDSEAAEPLLTQLLELSLARGEVARAERCEVLLTNRPGGATATVMLRLGELHLRFGDATGAASWFKRAASANPGDTRAVAQLATLLRHAGALEEEGAALRVLVERTQDPDELERAGQRLVTLALAQGKAVELVRWLDAIAPNHARRQDLWRLRMAAWESWQRTAPLDDPGAVSGPLPGPGPLGEALASGDLGAQVRALRHLASQGRPLPEALARQFLTGDSPVLRRDAALALGASGSVKSAEIVRDVLADGVGPDEPALLALLWAMGRLPSVDGTELVLAQYGKRSSVAGPLATLILGNHGSADRLAELAGLVHGPRRELAAAALLALGAALPRHRATAQGEQARRFLRAHLGHVALVNDPTRQAAALWALAASGAGAAGAEDAVPLLLRASLTLQQPTLVRMALVLAGSPAPQLALPLIAVGDAEALRELPARSVRDLLAPWIQPDQAEVSAAWARLQEPLRAMATAQPAAAAAAWCGVVSAAEAAAIGLRCDVPTPAGQ